MIKVLSHEQNRDIQGHEFAIVVNNADDKGSAEAGVNCNQAAYHIGLRLHHLFAGTGVRLDDQAIIDYRAEDTPGNRDPKAKKLEAVVSAAQKGADAVELQLRYGRTVLSLGGNHVRGFDVIGAMRFAHERGIELGLIWVDAHPDLNTPQSTITGNLHGMVSAVLTGKGGPRELLELLKGAPFIKPENIMYIGLNSIDNPKGQELTERKYLDELQALGTKVFEMGEVRNPKNRDKMPKHILEAISEFGGRLQEKGGEVWVELDADVFRTADMPGAVMDNKRGMRAKQGYDLFRHIGRSMPVMGMGVSELAPDKDPDHKGAEVVSRCIAHTMGVNHPLYKELKTAEPDAVNVYTFDKTREKIHLGKNRWLYKRPGYEYLQPNGDPYDTGMQDCYVCRDGKVVEILRGGWDDTRPDIRIGSTVDIRTYFGSGHGTVTKIVMPYTEGQTDDNIQVERTPGNHDYYKINELIVQE